MLERKKENPAQTRVAACRLARLTGGLLFDAAAPTFDAALHPAEMFGRRPNREEELVRGTR
jgi:hypothetical protein